MRCQRINSKYWNRLYKETEPPPHTISSGKNCLVSTLFLSVLTHLLFPHADSSQMSPKQVIRNRSLGHRTLVPGDTTGQLWNCRPMKVESKAHYTHSEGVSRWQSSLIFLQTSWHHELSECSDSVWMCLHVYRQRLSSMLRCGQKGSNNQKTKKYI